MPTNWAVVPICLPTIVRRCHACASDRFHANGKFRVNANHKLLDAWLLALCAVCGDTTKLTVFERTKVRAARPELLDRLHHNDIGLAAELLQDPGVRRRNHIRLDWANAWRLDTGTPRHDRDVVDAAGSPGALPLDVVVRFAARIPVRPVRLIGEGLRLSRAEVERLVAEGGLVSAVRLGGRRSDDFSFTLRKIGHSQTVFDPQGP
ncbi:hypothetical protein GCM10009721_38330 [Terrabacter tumescens]|uniref:DUF1062 domain-containing protein n=1 Tax=Terrabacter tumescens TaxID=60443 RepID=A0ABQ2IFL6_9MICO|nr:DUF1062 domain-containing protein [Terrabacter tumescens]GGN06987.1 hypothetical protein GCM10009721_38330 [Terrabacter tumescens]